MRPDVGGGRECAFRGHAWVISPLFMTWKFFASLHDNLEDPLAHWTLQNLVPMFCDPKDVKAVVKLRVRSC
jgi:hypothetical protein